MHPNKQLSASPTVPACTDKRSKEAGIAILSVAVILVVLGGITAEFAYNANVELESALTAYDRVRTEQWARSGVQLGQLFLQADSQLQQLPGMSGSGFTITPYADMLVQKILGDTPNALPKDASLSITLLSEEGKFPLHCAGGFSPQKTQQRLTYSLLTSLLSPPRLDVFFDKDSPDGFRITRLDMARWTIDWMDFNERRFDERVVDANSESSSPEDTYDRLATPYEMHNHYLDSAEELYQVRGIRHPLLLRKLLHSVTPYGSRECKVSLTATNAQSATLWEALLSAASSQPSTAWDPNTKALAEQLATLGPYIPALLKSNPLPKSTSPACVSPGPAVCPVLPKTAGEGTSTQTLNDLSSFICSPLIAKLPEYANLFKNQLQDTPAVPANPLHPIPLCPGALAQYLSASSSAPKRWYRFVATGTLMRGQKAGIQTTIEAVWDAAAYNNNPLCEKPTCKRGTWSYFRIH